MTREAWVAGRDAAMTSAKLAAGISCNAAMRGAVAIALLGTVVSARAAIEVVDDTGAAVKLGSPASRIVSLAPHATELLYAAGAGDRVVGVLATSDWPPEALSKPKVGDSRALDLERILLLKPDLVVTWPFAAPAQVGALTARGIPVFVANPATIEGIAEDMERLGALAGTMAAGSSRAAEFRAQLAKLSAAYAATKTVRVFYEIWDVPLYTIGGRHLISQALTVCGGENVFADLLLPAPGVSVEAVLAAKPDAIIAGADRAVRPSWLDEWKRWTTLPAVAHGNLFTVDANLLHRAGPRFIDGMETLCAVVARARAALR